MDATSEPTAESPSDNVANGDSRFSITTQDVSLWYGDFQALFDVTVKIRPGNYHGTYRALGLWQNDAAS